MSLTDSVKSDLSPSMISGSIQLANYSESTFSAIEKSGVLPESLTNNYHKSVGLGHGKQPCSRKSRASAASNSTRLRQTNCSKLRKVRSSVPSVPASIRIVPGRSGVKRAQLHKGQDQPASEPGSDVDVTIGLGRVLGFIVSKHPAFKRWRRAKLKAWVGWHMQNGFILPVGDGSNIAGLIIVRPIMEIEQANNGYGFDAQGLCLYVAGFISDSRETMRALGVAVHDRFGRRPFIAWHRRCDKKLVMYPTIAMARRVFYGTAAAA